MPWLPLTLWLLLLAACLPAVLRQLLPPLPPDDDERSPGCVLVLLEGLGRRRQGRPSAAALIRLQAAIALSRREKLPLLISGGNAAPRPPVGDSLLTLARRSLDSEQPVYWDEYGANFHESAANCVDILKNMRVGRVYVVTHRVALCRALLCLRRQRLSAVPVAADQLPAPGWLPHAGSLALWPELMREWVLLGCYAIRRWL